MQQYLRHLEHYEAEQWQAFIAGFGDDEPDDTNGEPRR
jgi:hypothetical protein